MTRNFGLDHYRKQGAIIDIAEGVAMFIGLLAFVAMMVTVGLFAAYAVGGF
jgi:hypothetical protein